MVRTAVFRLADGSSFVAEVEDEPVELHRVMRGGNVPAELIEKAGDSFEAAMGCVRNAADALLKNLSGLATPPDELEVEFGVKLSAEAGAVIAKAATEASFTVTLKWSRERTGKTA